MAEPVTGRQIVADLVELGVDPTVVRHVRLGLAAIAQEIRELPVGEVRDHVTGRTYGTAQIDRGAVVALVNPEAPT